MKRNRACGAVGSALPWHGRGREFESHQVHQTFRRLTLTPNYQSYVQLKSGTAPHVDLAEWRLPHRAAQLARWHRRSEIEDQEAPAYVGYLVERYRLQAAAERAHPEKWVFTLTDGSALPLWIPASGKLRGGRQRSRAAICPVSVRTLSGAPISRGGRRKARRASKRRRSPATARSG